MSALRIFCRYIDRRFYPYGQPTKSYSWAIGVFLICIIFTPLVHLLFPLWCFILILPWLVTCLIYLRHAQRKSINSAKILGIRLPLIPVSPLRVAQITEALIDNMSAFLAGPPIWIAWQKIKNVWTNQKLEKQALLAKNVYFGSKCYSTRLDVYGTPLQLPHDESYRSDRRNERPTLVFCYGGGWSSGSRRLYVPFAMKFAAKGYRVVLFDYTKWPVATIDDMVFDVRKAIEWTLNNIKRFGGDPNNVVVVAHSSGVFFVYLGSFVLIGFGASCRICA